ncbi:MAG: hypothetical protein ACYTG5_02890 [Planctomycetota bacterium]
MDTPELHFSPQVLLYTLEGDAEMQSAFGNLTTDMDTRNFGADDRDSDYGGVISYGDGFSGFEVAYFNYDMDSKDRGVLISDFGTVPGASVVNSTFKMNEYRLGYTAQIFEQSITIREDQDDLMARVGIGAAMVHRDGRFKVEQVISPVISERIHFKDSGAPYFSARGEVEWLNASLRVDYAINPDISFGGDFEDTMQDLEFTLEYSFPDQGVSIFAGWRRSELPAEGREDGLRYETDFRLEGYVLGLSATF